MHPARPSGRWVAGCCASGPDLPYRCGVTEAPAPLSSSPDGPAHRIGSPQQRLRAAGPVVVSRVEVGVEPAERMSNARPVPSRLRWVLVIQDPHRRTRAHHKTCGRLQEKVTASSLLNAGASTVKKDNR